MKPLFRKRKKLSASSRLLAGLCLCIILSVGCSVVKNIPEKSNESSNIVEKEGSGEKNSNTTTAAQTSNASSKKEKRDDSTENFIKKVSGNKISIVCTTFPQYDWVKNILGTNAKRFDVTLLLNNGVDMHSYQPAVRDIALVGSADLFLYVGGESDTWVTDALKEAKNKKLKALNLMNTLGDFVKEEKVVEGMQEEKSLLGHSHNEAKEQSPEGKEDPDGEIEYDEHIWLSVRNAEVLVKNIEKAIEQLDGDNAKVYQTNAERYIEKLKELDNQYAKTIQNAKYKAILFGDRFPFRYMADDYQLKYYAAFVGCSAETMAGFETVTFLANKADELQLPVILTIENSDGRIAEAIKTNTQKKNQRILAMNSLQSVTKEQLAAGITYLKVMKGNLAVLSEALN